MPIITVQNENTLSYKGYFAFPPAGTARTPLSTLSSQQQATDASAHSEDDPLLDQKRTKEQAWEERCRRDAEARKNRLEREQTEALRGEMEWVRAGGTLRDMYGRRDTLRTEQLRAEIRQQDEEKRVNTMWETYEARWRDVLASSSPSSSPSMATAPLTFKDIPWPLGNPAPSGPKELTLPAVEDFLFASLRVRTNTVSRRDRIRASILRWHPDKIAGILARVGPDDQDAVIAGVNAVFHCLRALQDAEKQT